LIECEIKKERDIWGEIEWEFFPQAKRIREDSGA
jgi:hypothetical protein